ncbi:hypothetical protein L6452_12778 [Arctium lappa]|uniref:Uncharacterized protein n=1 Tax=Arctium lappa TaxID=4217 RepID=A0ACB9CGF7_ARCLA|nr:hypothetical protein L6452_12778 [Arctium lappa]
MECNRDEATRAKEIAERKLSAKDIAGAKKFALKAQCLYPGLDGISQLLATLDVYVAAENKINGESDFYGILGVSPSADDDTVRKHYRKLALFLHPDKNKSVGADGAFKHISEAWSLVSDKAKRSAYDQRRNYKVFKQNGVTAAAPPPPGQNGFYNFTRSTTTRTKGTTTTPKDYTNATTSTGPTSDPLSSNKQTNLKTFWTVCHGCKMQYEYLRMYLHQNLLCPNCHEPFLAMETPAPNTKISTKASKFSKGASKNSSNPGRHRTTSQKGESGQFGDPSNYTGFQWGPFSKTTNPASSAQAASMVQRAYERVKREREEAQAAIKREEALRRKKNSKRAANLSSSGHLNSVKRKQGAEDVNFMSLSGLKQGSIGLVDGRKGVPITDIRTQLVEKARSEIRKKLQKWSSESVLNSKVGMEDRVTEKAGRKDEEKEGDDPINGDSKKNAIEPLMINVQDPDFHNFDRDRCERCFGEGQVWAAYDDDDGMPRHYAMIRKVISVDPFKLKVCWLNSRTNSELDVFSGFSKAFGEFRTGKHEILSVSNYFSHKVHFSKLENGTIQVYPRKGDVWALYRYWSAEWNEETPNEVKHKYEIVEVDELDEEAGGFTVTQLVKVAGFKTVFHRHLNPKEARTIPEGEIFRFSHQIPSYLLTGQEAPNAPKGCCELDPAATPDEFLQVIADVQEAENIDDKDFASESNHESAALADVKEVVNVDDE